MTDAAKDQIRAAFAEMPRSGRAGSGFLAIELAADRHGVSFAEIVGPRRVKCFVDARSDVAFALRQVGWSYPRIGRLLGDRDHTTIMNLIRRRDAKARAD